jgi:hypothetical protein
MMINQHTMNHCACVNAGASATSSLVAARFSTAARDDPAEELSGLRPAAAAQVSYAELASTIYSVSQKLGPVTLGDLVFGIQALAKRHAAERLTYHIQVTTYSSWLPSCCSQASMLDRRFGH